jgi:small subunit ribosomal protein S15
MSQYLSKEKQDSIFADYAGSAANTGSAEGQVALFTFRITNLSEHLKTNKKDHVTRRSLMRLVGQRKSLLSYIAKKDILKYRALIVKLGIRDVIKSTSY